MKKPGRFFPSSRLYLQRFCYGRMAQLRDTFSHFWLAIPQLVLHALWQDVWHSPHPPFSRDLTISRVFRVSMCFISQILSAADNCGTVFIIRPSGPPIHNASLHFPFFICQCSRHFSETDNSRLFSTLHSSRCPLCASIFRILRARLLWTTPVLAMTKISMIMNRCAMKRLTTTPFALSR